MQTVLLVSTRPAAGKTAMAVALIELLRRDGRTVKYAKAIETGDLPGDASPDAQFMSSYLGQPVAAAASVGHSSIATAIDRAATPDGAIAALRAAGADADALIVEAGDTLLQGWGLGLSAQHLATALDAQTIVVARYQGDDVVDELAPASALLGDRLLGAVITAIPAARVDGAVDRLGGFLRARGVRLLGVVPFDPSLAAATVRQLADHLDGQIMNNAEKADALIEHVMMGTVTLGKASDYFRRYAAKAVIAHGARPDIHLAALETDTRCIVLCSNVVPNPIVMARAEEEEVPLIMVKQDPLTVLELIEQLYPTGRFAQRGKVARVTDLVATHVDLRALRAPSSAGA